MFVQLDKLERAGAIHTNPGAGAAQSVMAARDVQPLALTEPIVECFPRSLPVLNRVGLSIADHLGEGRQSRRCRLLVRCGDDAGHFGIMDNREYCPSWCRLAVGPIEPPDHRPVVLSHDNRHRRDLPRRRDGNARDLLRHDQNPQRLNSPPSHAEIGGIIGRHRPGRLLLLPNPSARLRPPSAQHIQQLAPIDTLMGDQHQSPMVAADHAGETDRAPSPKAPRRSVSDIAQTATEPA